MNNNVVPVLVNGSLQYVPLHILLQSGQQLQQFQGVNFNPFGEGNKGGRRRRSRKGNQQWQSMNSIPYSGGGIPFGMTPFQGYGVSQQRQDDGGIRKTLRRLEQQLSSLIGTSSNTNGGQQPQQPSITS